MRNTKLLVGLFSFLSFLLVINLVLGGIGVPSSDNAQALEYHSRVDVYKNNELWSSGENTLYNTGAELIETAIADGGLGGDAADWIELCDETNATCGAVAADSGGAYTAWEDSGLDRAAGTVFDNGNGNWTISKTFTSTVDGAITNVTNLENAAGTEFAGNSFTSVTLQTDDQLTINWTVWVS